MEIKRNGKAVDWMEKVADSEWRSAADSADANDRT